MRRFRLPLVLALVVVAIAAHWLYWYAPAERAGHPEASSVAGRLFLDGQLPYRLWLPHPHQNLAVLERSLGPLDDLLAEIGRLRGDVEVPDVPRFGGLRLPPSSELAVATDEEGTALVVAAEVYPVVGLLSRWAGRLAGNPLLAGGRARLGGREVEVRWHAGTWILSTTPGAAGALIEPADEGRRLRGAPRADEIALAWFRLERSERYLPAAVYRLERRQEDLELVGGDVSRLRSLGDLAARSAPLPLTWAQVAAEASTPAARAFGLIPGLDSLGGLPGAVAAHHGGEAFRLPGEKIATTLGDGVLVQQAGQWEIRALDSGSLDRGAELARFAAALEPDEPLEVAMWIELRPAERLVQQVAEALEAVPIVGRREAERWRVAEDLLHRLAAFERLTVVISPAPAAVHVRLWRDARRAN